VKILVAEDDRVVSQLVCSVVRQAGHTPVPAYDAMQTLMFAMRTPVPDLIILDLNMPGGTGVDALRRLKTSSKTAAIPVVVLSGSTDERTPATVKELGAESFLPKPVDSDALQAAIRDALPHPPG
jgi:DNA-binding response OmpR family regulator